MKKLIAIIMLSSIAPTVLACASNYIDYCLQQQAKEKAQQQIAAQQSNTSAPTSVSREEDLGRMLAYRASFDQKPAQRNSLCTYIRRMLCPRRQKLN